MNADCGFIGYLPSFHFGEAAILISVDAESLKWLISRFQELASPAPRAGEFMLGDGNPIESDGRLLVTVRAGQCEEGARLVRVASDRFDWIISRESAQRFDKLLLGLFSRHTAAHQYLDSGDRASPTVIVSKGEYPIDKIRSWVHP